LNGIALTRYPITGFDISAHTGIIDFNRIQNKTLISNNKTW
jgi:hypothetical protein